MWRAPLQSLHPTIKLVLCHQRDRYALIMHLTSPSANSWKGSDGIIFRWMIWVNPHGEDHTGRKRIRVQSGCIPTGMACRSAHSTGPSPPVRGQNHRRTSNNGDYSRFPRRSSPLRFSPRRQWPPLRMLRRWRTPARYRGTLALLRCWSSPDPVHWRRHQLTATVGHPDSQDANQGLKSPPITAHNRRSEANPTSWSPTVSPRVKTLKEARFAGSVIQFRDRTEMRFSSTNFWRRSRGLLQWLRFVWTDLIVVACLNGWRFGRRSCFWPPFPTRNLPSSCLAPWCRSP